MLVEVIEYALWVPHPFFFVYCEKPCEKPCEKTYDFVF